jgi:hypothetical protein
MAAFVCFGLCFGATVMAQEFTAGKIRYRVTGDRTVAVSGHTNPKVRSIEIPATVKNSGNSYRVTAIGDDAFRKCENLVSARLPESLTDIGKYAFLYCYKLTDINIPRNVKSIGEDAFYRCINLASVRLPEGITDIGRGAFHSCSSLTDINIPSSVKSISASTFSGCIRLASVRLPEGLTGIGTDAFCSCGSLTDLNIPSSVKYIDTEAFMDCHKLTVKSIPDGLERVGLNSFKGCRVDGNIKQQLGRIYYAGIASTEGITYRITGTGSVSVTGIGEGKSGQKLKILIPETASIDGREYTVTSIADSAFFRKRDIEMVIFPQTVEHIGNASFERSGLKNTYFSEGLKSIGNNAFEYCYLSDIAIPQSVTSIGSRAFYSYSNRIAITALPAGLQKTGKDAFFRCKFAGGLVLPDVLLAQIAKDDTENERMKWEHLQNNNDNDPDIYRHYISFIEDECYTPEILAAAKEKLWTSIRKADRKHYYSTYINNKEAALPEYLTQAKERIKWCEANKATVVMDSPEKVKSSNGCWSIDVRFRETGGNAGVTLFPTNHYVWWKGSSYEFVETQNGIRVSEGKKGSVKLDKNGSGSYSDHICRNGFGSGAAYHITWSGADDYGNKISIEQKVILE